MQFLETYNLIDLFILGTVLVTLILGIWKGFVRNVDGTGQPGARGVAGLKILSCSGRVSGKNHEA